MSIYCALWGKGFQPDQVLSFKNQFHVVNIALENLSDEQYILRATNTLLLIFICESLSYVVTPSSYLLQPYDFHGPSER